MDAEIDRADKILVQLGHFDSRAAAHAAIAAGNVNVNGSPVTKPSQKIAASAHITARPVHAYVSRGALKLVHAIETFKIAVKGRTCLDIGASTGGFSQVLLQAGARRVVAVDVGHGQLHKSLADEPRLVGLERTDARALTADQLGTAPNLIVCDASFISLHKLLPTPLSLAALNAELICLFKPQFEVGRAHIGKGGIVTDTAAITVAEDRFCAWLAAQDWRVRARIDSPIAGGDGNAERLIWASLQDRADQVPLAAD